METWVENVNKNIKGKINRLYVCYFKYNFHKFPFEFGVTFVCQGFHMNLEV